MNDDTMKESVNKELLARFVRGECTEAEQEQVKAFLNQPAWQQALEELLQDDFDSFAHTAYTEADNAAWNQRFRENYANRAIVRRRWNIRWIGYAAAACVLLAFIGYWYIDTRRQAGVAMEQPIAMLVKANAKGQRSVVTLPDSTVVYLGAASSLHYPERFGPGNREVSLEGEAYFEVAHDKQHPFTVQTGMIQTKVLGTSFKIDAFKGVTVSVTTGKVQVAKLDSSHVAGAPLAILTPGKQVMWDAQSEKVALADINATMITAWKDGKASFVNASLSDIAETLGRWYDVDIQFNNERIARTRLSIIVKAATPVQHSLDIICSTLHLKYTFNGKTIMIKN